MDSVSVSAPPGSPRLIAQGFPTTFTEPGPRLGRERLRNDGKRRKPVRGENPCAARISAVSSKWHEHLMLTTDQLVAVGRAPLQRWRLRATARGRVRIEPRICGIVEKAW